MGADPTTSVTGPDGRVHDAENVYVGDGALLPYPAGTNPALTIQAVALRVAHRLLTARFGITRMPLLDAVTSPAAQVQPAGGRAAAGAPSPQPVALSLSRHLSPR